VVAFLGEDTEVTEAPREWRVEFTGASEDMTEGLVAEASGAVEGFPEGGATAAVEDSGADFEVEDTRHKSRVLLLYCHPACFRVSRPGKIDSRTGQVKK
jgi:hypothetical protein